MPPTCQLYLITPPRIELSAFTEQFKQALDGGAVSTLQLRLKEVAPDDVKRAAETLLPICQEHDVVFLLNDDPALVAPLGADGVHLGKDDMPYKHARELLGESKIIGVSCYDSTDRAMQLADAGADYIAFGAFFPTTTKETTATPTLEMLASWSSFTEVPTVAIGGITLENCASLIEHGADFLAVISAIWQHPNGPKAAVRAFHDVIARTPNRAAAISLS